MWLQIIVARSRRNANFRLTAVVAVMDQPDGDVPGVLVAPPLMVAYRNEPLAASETNQPEPPETHAASSKRCPLPHQRKDGDRDAPTFDPTLSIVLRKTNPVVIARTRTNRSRGTMDPADPQRRSATALARRAAMHEWRKHNVSGRHVA